MLAILKQIIDTSSTGSALMKIRNNQNLALWINESTTLFQNIKQVERIYIILNGEPPKCKCGNNRVFNSLTKGYRSGCHLGNKCISVSEDRSNNHKQNLIEKYGVSNINYIPGVAEKRKETMIERYGVEYAAQNRQIKSKQQETFNNRTIEDILTSKEKYKSTSLDHYGVEHHMKSKIQQKKLQDTNQERYGVSFPLQHDEINARFVHTLANRSESEIQKINQKHKNTVKSKYDVDSSMQIHIGRETLDILNDKVSFEQVITDLTRKEACITLGISETYLRRFTTMHNSNDKFAKPEKSKEELEICEFITSLNIEYETGNRQLISPKELDIYIPSLRIAIEYGGLYWHSENSSGRASNYHKSKFDECAKQDIRLITIFGDEWNTKKDLCKSLIRNAVNAVENNIYARRCKIKVVSKTEQVQFLTDNHIQGKLTSEVAIGLYFSDELVSLMTFGKSRFNKKVDYELLRFCNKKNTTVVGGASKLFSYFTKNYTFTTLVSYCDQRWFSGSLYEHLGFTKGKTVVGYHYTNYFERFSRIKFQKHKIISLVEDGNSKTEWDIMQELGYDRIWDCGQTSWVFTKA